MSGNNISIVIPSFNESKNLKILIERILKNLNGAKIIIVDDSKTSENKKIQKLVDDFKNKNITLITRAKKLGRGSAVAFGFKEALRDIKIQYIFEMDSDLSHLPEEFKIFLAKRKKYDLIVGSRYLDGSKIVDWPIKRIILSKLINAFLNLLLGVKLTDYTNGYRLYSRRAVEYLNTLEFKSTGFTLLSETAYRLKQKKYKITEVPASFLERQFGESSVTGGQLISSFISVIHFRFF